MATAYTSLLGLALPVTGELSGSWGDTVNDAITSLLDTAVAGTTSITADADITLTTTTGASNQARQAIILWNPASGTTTRNITAPAQSKIYTVINASGGTQSIVFRGAGPTTGVTIVKGESAVVAWNGTDFIKVSNTGGAASFTNVTVSGTTTLSGLTASTALALDASKNVVSVTNTGTGNNVLATSPTLVTPALGTPSSATLTNATGLPVSTGISGLGTGIATALAVNVGTAGAPVINGGVLGTPSSGTVTNLTGTASININGTVGATTASTGAFTTLTTSSTVTHNGGTANGVAYLNGSKVLTTGSALTFDGTNLGVGTASPSGSAGYTYLSINNATNGSVISLRFSGAEKSAFYYDNASNTTNLFNNTTSGQLIFGVNSSERMRLDSSGNLGLGVTPSAWNGVFRAIEGSSSGAKGSALIFNTSNQQTMVSANAYFDSSWKYGANGTAAYYSLEVGAHKWFTAPSGTAGNAITFTQAMTLDAAGNWMVGATSALGRATIVQGASSNTDTLVLKSPNTSGAGSQPGIQFLRDTNAVLAKVFADTNTGALITEVNGAERARIDSSGNLLVGTTSTVQGGKYSSAFDGQVNSGIGLQTTFASSGTAFVRFVNSAGTTQGEIVANATTTVLYSVTSDRRLKENISDAAPVSDLIDSLQVRQYDWKENGLHQSYGFVAQELVTVAPEAVHQPADPEAMMAVDYSKLVPMLVKEIQSLRQRLAAAGI